MIDESRWESQELVPPVEEPHWALRFYRWASEQYRPHLGWLVFLTTLIVTWLPALALGENRITEIRRMQVGIDLVGPAAVVTVWLLWGWRAPRTATRRHLWVGIGSFLLFLLIGVVVITQALVSWLPGIRQLWQTLLSGSWPALLQGVFADWQQLFTRFALWWQGVQGGGAAQDNLVFAAIAGLLFWSVGALTAWLLRRTERGLLATSPLLWLLGTMLLYTTTNRGLMLAGLSLAVALHLLLDQRHLLQRWQARGLDYSPDLVVDRTVVILLVGFLLFMLAALLPNLYYRPLVIRYYAWIQPVDDRMEALRDRLFPDLAGISRRQGAGAGGLPNAFLLGGAVDLGESVVMQLRT
ncbi:MAG: hypothetical protein R2867_34765, partial [Caldilineaceae bacterium]